MKKRMTALLLAVFLLGTGGCAGAPGYSEGTSDGEPELTEAPTLPPVSLADYVVVRPENSDDYETAVAVEIRSRLVEAGCKGTITTDWVRNPEDLPAEGKEILIGRTNRPESEELYSGIRTDDSTVRLFPSGRIAVAGGSEEALRRAAAELLARLQDGAVPADLSYAASGREYPVKELKIGGISIGEFGIFTSKFASPDETYAASLLADAVQNTQGCVMISRRLNEKKPGEHGIVLDGSPEDGRVPTEGFGIDFDGTDVYIRGKNGLLVAGTRAFLALLLPENAAGTVELSLPESTQGRYEAPVLPSLDELGALPVALVDQKNACMTVVDASVLLRGEQPVQTYRFAPTRANGFYPDSTYGNRIDEARFRYSEKNGTFVICFTSSSGYFGIAEYPSGKCLFERSLAGYGPHCAEYLPNGNLALALSGNGAENKSRIRVYAASQGKNSAIFAEQSLDGAHSVLWDPLRSILWALGSSEVRAYEIGGTDAKPTLTPIDCYGCKGSFGGHDMGTVAGNPDLLLISGSGAYVFNRATGSVDKTLPDTLGLGVKSTKCLCTALLDGKLCAVRTVATGVYAAHNTDTFTLFVLNGPTLRGDAAVSVYPAAFANAAFYKARIVDPGYYQPTENPS